MNYSDDIGLVDTNAQLQRPATESPPLRSEVEQAFRNTTGR